MKSKIPLSFLEEGLEVDVRIICLYLVFGMHGSLAYAYFKSIICGGAGKNGSTVAVRERSKIPLNWLTNWHWLEIYTMKIGTKDLEMQQKFTKKYTLPLCRRYKNPDFKWIPSKLSSNNPNPWYPNIHIRAFLKLYC